jgi:hypothetical protein
MIVAAKLLLDAGERNELLRELIGIERLKRILVLQLRGQQRQKRLEIGGKRLPADRLSVACADCVDGHGWLLDPDVHAAARAGG